MCSFMQLPGKKQRGIALSVSSESSEAADITSKMVVPSSSLGIFRYLHRRGFYWKITCIKYFKCTYHLMGMILFKRMVWLQDSCNLLCEIHKVCHRYSLEVCLTVVQEIEQLASNFHVRVSKVYIYLSQNCLRRILFCLQL